MLLFDPMVSIRKVIMRRRARGASEEDIKAYKEYLLSVWKHSEYLTEKIKGLK